MTDECHALDLFPPDLLTPPRPRRAPGLSCGAASLDAEGRACRVVHAVEDQGFYSRMPDVLAVMLRTNMPMRRPMRRPTTAARQDPR